MEFDQEVDAIGLKCPLPILRCKKAMSALASGQVLKISTTDTGAPKDFNAFCSQTGHAILKTETIDTITIFYIKKRADV